MLEFVKELLSGAESYRGMGHPLEITRELAGEHDAISRRVMANLRLNEPLPRLAELVAASPLEAALFDAYGKTLRANTYKLLSDEFVNSDLASYLNADFAGEFLDRYTLRRPKPRIPLYHLVGALDPLSDEEVQTPVGDGLPETLGQWIVFNGLTHLKIKLAGDDLPWDVQRVAAVERAAAQAQAQRGCEQWHYSLDFNEKCANVQYVLDFLAQLRETSPTALDRVQYIEHLRIGT